MAKQAWKLTAAHTSAFSVPFRGLCFLGRDFLGGGGRGPHYVSAILQVGFRSGAGGWRGVAAIVAAILADRIKDKAPIRIQPVTQRLAIHVIARKCW